MRNIAWPWGLIAGVAAALIVSAGTAQARRPSCDDIAAARTAGKADDEIKTALGVTSARIEACDRIAADREETAARRERIRAARAARGIAMH